MISAGLLVTFAATDKLIFLLMSVAVTTITIMNVITEKALDPKTKQIACPPHKYVKTYAGLLCEKCGWRPSE